MRIQMSAIIEAGEIVCYGHLLQEFFLLQKLLLLFADGHMGITLARTSTC